MSQTASRLPKWWSALAWFACLGVTASAVGQTVHVDDTFDIDFGTIDDDPGDPLDIAWSAGTVIDDSGNLGSGNAIQQGSDFFGEIPLLDQPGLGEFVRLSWDFRFEGMPINTPGDASNGNLGYRIYLTPESVRSTGYGMRIGTGGDGVAGNPGNGIGLRQGNFRAGPYDALGADGIYDGQPTQNSTFSVNDNEPHSASITIMGDIVETEIGGVPTGLVEGIRLEGMVDDVLVTGVFPYGFEDQIEILPLEPFNYIFIDQNGSGVDFVMDNIRVESGLVGPPLAPGDINGDAAVDLDDFDVIRANFLQMVATRADGDLTRDGLVEFADFREWKDNRTAGFGGAAAIPEPASGALLLVLATVGLCGSTLRRRGS